MNKLYKIIQVILRGKKTFLVRKIISSNDQNWKSKLWFYAVSVIFLGNNGGIKNKTHILKIKKNYKTYKYLCEFTGLSLKSYYKHWSENPLADKNWKLNWTFLKHEVSCTLVRTSVYPFMSQLHISTFFPRTSG